MAGINFHIGAENSDFIRKLKQTQDALRSANEVMQDVGKNFDTSTPQKQIVALNRVIEETKNSIDREVKELNNLQQEANKAFQSGDTKQMEYFNSLVNVQAKSIADLTKDLEKYEKTLYTVEQTAGAATSIPSITSPQLYTDKASYDNAQSLRDQQAALRSEIANFNYDLSDPTGSDTQLDALYTKLGEVTSKLRETETAAADAAAKLGAGLGGRASEVSTALFELQNSIDGQKKEVARLGNEAANAAANLEQLRSSGANIADIENARVEYDSLSTSLTNAENELRNMQAAEKDMQADWQNLSAQIGNSPDGMESKAESMRTQMRAMQQEIAELLIQYRAMSAEEQNSADGQAMKQHIDELTEKAGVLRDAYSDASAAVTNAASDTRTFDQVAGGLRFMTDSFGLATSAAQMFGANQEDLVAVQTKLQAAMVASNALTSMQNNLQKQSALMQGINILQTKAATVATNIKTAAEGKGIIVTKLATVAQAAFNLVANANPYVLLATGIAAVIAAFIAFSSGAEEATENTKEFQDALTEAAFKPISTIEELSIAWSRLGDNIAEKKKFIEEHQKDFEELGIVIKEVADAENLLVENKEAFINAQYAKAKAEAYRQINQELIKKRIQQQQEIEEKAANRAHTGSVFSYDWFDVNVLQTTGLRDSAEDIRKEGKEELEKLDAEIRENFEKAADSFEEGSDMLRDANIVSQDKVMDNTNAMMAYIEEGTAGTEFVLENLADDLSKTYIDNLQKFSTATANFINTAKEFFSFSNLLGTRLGEGITLKNLLSSGGDVISSWWGKVTSKDNFGKHSVSQRVSVAEKQIKAEEQKLNRLRAADSKATVKEIEAQEEIINNLKKSYKSLTGEEYGKEDKKRAAKRKNSPSNKTDRAAEEAKRAEEKAADELNKLRENNLAEEISQMQKGTEQRVKQIEFDYEQRIAEITEMENEFAELNKKRKATGLNTFGLTDEQQEEINKARELALKAKNQSLKDENESEQQYKIDYLKQYGNLQEQRLAIAEEYDKKIAKESNEWARKALEEQKRLALKNLSDTTLELEFLKQYGTFLQKKYAIQKDYDQQIKEAESKGDTWHVEALKRERTAEIANLTVQNLNGSIDWTKRFDGVGNVLQDMAKDTLAKLDEYMQSDEYKGLDAVNKKAYADFANQLRAEVGGAANPFNFGIWGQIEDYTKQYRDSVKQLQEAQERHKTAVEQLDVAQKLYDSATDSQFKDIYKTMVEKAKEAVENTAKEVTNAETNSTNAGNNLNRATSEATNGLNNFAEALNELTGGSLYGFANGLTKLITSLSNGGVEKSINEIGGKVGGMIGAALTLMDAMGDVPAEFTEDLFNKMATAAEESFAQLPAILLSVLEGVGGVVGGIFSGLGKMVGIETESDPRLVKDIERLTASNEALEKSVSMLSDKMDDANLIDSAEIYKSQIDAITQSMLNTQEMMSRSGAAYDKGFLGIGGHHSSNKKIDDEMSKTEWQQISDILGKATYSASDFWDLTSEQMAMIAEKAPHLYTKIKALADDGYKDAAQYMDEYIEYYKELEAATDAYAEHITSVSFDSLRDSFADALMDMDKSAEDFAEDFKKYMMQAVLNAKISDLMNEDLKTWYDSWAKYSEDGLNRDEIDELQKEWDKIVQKGIAIRDSAAAATGYTGETLSAQRSTAGGYETMSEDTGQELNGRFTAIQDSNERIAQSMEAAMSVFQNLLITNTDGNIILNNILLQNVRTNDYLDDIKNYTKTMRGFGDKLDAIVINTSNL